MMMKMNEMTDEHLEEQKLIAHRNLEYAYAVCLGALKAIQAGFFDHHYDRDVSVKKFAADAVYEARNTTSSKNNGDHIVE